MNYYLTVFKKYAVFTGRARRAEYWTFTLVNIGIFYILGIPAATIDSDFNHPVSKLLLIILILYIVACIVPGLAVSVRRLHDTNRTGWWILCRVIPVAGPLLLLIFNLTDSQPGSNPYGPNPKQ